MEKYIGTILELLELALVSSVLATNIVNGVKNATGVANAIVVRIIVAAIDIFTTYWVYFIVFKLTNLITFAMACICCYAGTEAIYQMMGGLTETKKKVEDINEELFKDDANINQEGLG